VVRLAFALLLAGCNQLFGLDPLEPVGDQPAAVVSYATGSCDACQTRSIAIDTVDARSNGLLLVHVVSTLAGQVIGAPPTISVTFDGRPLTLVTRATIPGDGAKPLLELWKLDDPEVGIHVVEVTVAATAAALIVGATQLEGVADVPVRGFASRGDEGQRATNGIESSAVDLVLDAVCTGGSIEAPGLDQVLLWTELRGDTSSCGNLATSIHPGDATVQLEWSVNANQLDWWLDLAASIAPAQ